MVDPTVENHRPRPIVRGWGQWLTGEGILSLFLGVRDMPQEELPALDAGQLS